MSVQTDSKSNQLVELLNENIEKSGARMNKPTSHFVSAQLLEYKCHGVILLNLPEF